ncbi:MAG: hypothetical protein KF730_12525 [Sphingomonas sp.]|uniref:hypothetical protein n=1 Tax=Sphingomonas sp. TaxID=28214 RepID=UPI0025F87618|nr:hypothetical protein [Sphingomonas sp.]MBX3565387.1 hypothetical protein [Sphingomonas sp.]
MKMRLKRWMTGLGIGALCAAVTVVTPGLQAQGRADRSDAGRPPVSIRSGIGTFTPAAADPKLAALLARSGLPNSGFRFTPSDSRLGSSRAVTVAVRARTTRGSPASVTQAAVATTPSLSLAPVAYNLGVSVGWKRFALSGDIAKVDLVTKPGGGELADLGISYTGKRASGRIRATSERNLTDAPVLAGEKPSYGFDLGGSYSVTRNLAVTAGVRYKSEDQRLPRLTDNRRDSQAVYVGTAFRF